MESKWIKGRVENSFDSFMWARYTQNYFSRFEGSGTSFEGSSRHRLAGRRPRETELLHIRKAKTSDEAEAQKGGGIRWGKTEWEIDRVEGSNFPTEAVGA